MFGPKTTALLALSTVLATPVAFGAQSDPADYARLLNEAHSKGAVRVLVTLDNSVTLERMKNDLASVNAETEAKAEALLAELGQDAMTSGYWNNGIGQVGVYVNAKGLGILANSTNAIDFSPDATQAYRIRAYGADGSLDAIESIINEKGFAVVEVFLNIDEGDYDIDRNGKTVFRPSPELSDQIARRLNNINAHPVARTFKNYDASPSRAPAPSPSFRARIDKNAFYELRESEDVRAIKPIGFVDARPAQWPADVLKSAQTDGSAEVIITLRGGAIFSAKAGFMSPKALKAQADANQRAFDDILADADTSSTSATVASYAATGAIHARVPYDVLARLYKNADPRILSIELNQPAAEAMLTNSTGLMNMQSAWNAGYRAAGQKIIVMDTGIRKNHELFKMNGATKVTYEACFGTDGSDGYRSICPSKDVKGDSPLGLAGSGEPYADVTTCASLAADNIDYHDCSHGTHVAGIAAGRQSPYISPSSLQGVAPDAELISAQVFSYDKTNLKAGAFNGDIQAALDAVLSATTPDTNNPYVVNVSLGGEIFSGDCPNYSINVKNAIESLASRGVPVVVATGNNGSSDGKSGSRNGISWPACVPYAIKVSSVFNDTNGTALAEFANIGDPANFTGPILLTPGGGGGTLVRSADRASTTATKQLQGTSQAAPHAAGVYAAIKAAIPGISVADATAWIITTGSIPVTYNLPAPVNTQTYRRIRIPNF
ncbi:S8 family serine peptidase [Methylobacter sp. BlB1]|uniref:S8 family peptidase n=1 Tax=Methylobacter sp. BlB1 TaxID=2785914 RepID=UPI0018930C7C|nr:S8 family serine peptidase [Methylobacter sp. BlB1]MBF6649106.1 S8 family serine peptidase [Methylobacter sp. BlB1]